MNWPTCYVAANTASESAGYRASRGSSSLRTMGRDLRVTPHWLGLRKKARKWPSPRTNPAWMNRWHLPRMTWDSARSCGKDGKVENDKDVYCNQVRWAMFDRCMFALFFSRVHVFPFEWFLEFHRGTWAVARIVLALWILMMVKSVVVNIAVE